MAAGIFGYILSHPDCEPTPLLLSFIISPMLEGNFHRAILISHGDFRTFVEKPISLTLILFAIGMLPAVLLLGIRRRREEIFVE